MINFDWEEGLFRGLYKTWQKAAHKQQNPSRVALDEVHSRLQTVAQLIAGRPLLVTAAEAIGGIRDQVVLLPAGIEKGPTQADNLTLYLVRVILNATMIELWGDTPPDMNGIVGRARYLFALAQARQHLETVCPEFSVIYTRALGWEISERPRPEEFEGPAAALERLRRQLAHGFPVDEEKTLQQFARLRDPGDLPIGLTLWGETLTPSDIHAADRLAVQEAESNPSADGTELKSKPRDHVALTCLEKTEEIAPMPLHTFEKTETLDTFKGGERQVDGSDELEEHQEALHELDLREVIRGGKPSHGYYKADIDLGGTIPDVHHILAGERGRTYPEWHYKKRTYRQDWVTVYPTSVPDHQYAMARSILAAHQGPVDRLSRRLLAQREKYALCRRQSQGDELDLEALVNAYGDRAAGRDPGEKLYQTQRKTHRDTAVTLLFDISLSSGSWVDGRRILDLTRETILIVGEVAERLGDQFRILAFASNTRNHCRAWDIKPWQDSWRRAVGRVCVLEPQGYTRIGPAIRHAVSGFEGIPGRRRGLLLITDGKPTDYDRYEGRYGREDVRMAIREGLDQGIHTHALALDARARGALPSMFGTAGWQILKRPADLADAVATAYAGFHQ